MTPYTPPPLAVRIALFPVGALALGAVIVAEFLEGRRSRRRR
jgi:hypothetical protein